MMFVKDGSGKYHKVKRYFYPNSNKFLKLAICLCGIKTSAINEKEELLEDEIICEKCLNLNQ